VEVNFSLVLFLALSAVIDLHVKLRRTNMEVKGHKEILLDVMVIHKLRPAALEVLLASTIVLDFNLIGGSSPRVFTKNCFAQFTTIHELSEFQRQPLNFTALRTGNTKKQENLWWRRRSVARRITWTRDSKRHFGFILTSGRTARTTLCRSGR
jgi:hypothetical protein